MQLLFSILSRQVVQFEEHFVLLGQALDGYIFRMKQGSLLCLSFPSARLLSDGRMV